MQHLIKQSYRGYDLVSPGDLLLTDRKIFFTSEVNSETCDNLIKNLMALDAESDKEITIFINSNGGDVLSGLAAYDVIQTLRSPVRTVVIGAAFSMGAILFLAGNSGRYVHCHSRIMIHDPSYSSSDIGGQKPHEIQKRVDNLMETRDTLAKIISEVTGKELNEVLDETREDSFYNAEEALKANLATGIIRNEEK